MSCKKIGSSFKTSMQMLEHILAHYSKEGVIETLAPFLTKERLQLIDRVLENRIGSVEIAVERPCDIHNAFAIIRTAEGLGLFHMHFINAEIKKRQGKGTSRGTIKWVHLYRHPSIEAFRRSKQTIHLAGACPDGDLELDSLPLDRPLCFLFGNEREGLSKEAKKSCDSLFRLPMFGMVESYNLSIAAALAASHFLNRKRKILGKNGDLGFEDFTQERARCFIRSLGIEKSIKILERSLNDSI